MREKYVNKMCFARDTDLNNLMRLDMCISINI